MKVRSLSTLLIGLSVTLSILSFSMSSIASTNDYSCAKLHGVWTTWVRTPRGIRPLIRWKNDQISGWQPKKRCIEVYKRMQRFSDNGTFNYLSTGVINSEPVICAVRSQGDNCTSRNVLVTLPRDLNPNQAIRQLTALSTTNILELSVSNSGIDRFVFSINGQTYIDMEVFKEELGKIEFNVTPLTPVE